MGMMLDMVTKKSVVNRPALFRRVREVLDAARTSIAHTVNATQVVANWLIGREIVEEEQRGQRRAGYGMELLSELAARLKHEFGAGYGVDNLELFRRFIWNTPGCYWECRPKKFPARRVGNLMARRSRCKLNTRCVPHRDNPGSSTPISRGHTIAGCCALTVCKPVTSTRSRQP